VRSLARQAQPLRNDRPASRSDSRDPQLRAAMRAGPRRCIRDGQITRPEKSKPAPVSGSIPSAVRAGPSALSEIEACSSTAPSKPSGAKEIAVVAGHWELRDAEADDLPAGPAPGHAPLTVTQGRVSAYPGNGRSATLRTPTDLGVGA
jgi:hypothetical protein